MSRLRTIAVHVEEPEPGRFAWVLTERDGPQWADVGRAAATTDTYRQAMADGLLELQSMAGDLDIGPRTQKAAAARESGKPGKPGKPGNPRKASTAAPKRPDADADNDNDNDNHNDADADADADADQTEPAPKRKAFFGFGPAR